MKNNTWLYTMNPFVTATTGSLRLMNLIGADHDAKLAASTGITGVDALYQHFHPRYLDFKAKYGYWLSLRRDYQAATSAFTEALNHLSGKLAENWQARVIIVYPSDSVGYLRLMPEHRAPFQKGAYEERIREIDAFFNSLGSEQSLEMLRNDVGNSYQILYSLRETQQGFEKRVAELSDELEEMRIALANAMHYTFAGLLQVYNGVTFKVENYFDLENIRSTSKPKDGTEEPVLKIAVNPAASKEAALTLTGDSFMQISNTGLTVLRVNMAASVSEVPAVGSLLNPGESLEATAVELGWTMDNHLFITNEDSSREGSVEIYLI